MRRYLLLLFLLSVPATAVAQSRFEVTPFVGLRAGGGLRALEQVFVIEAQSSVGGGLMLDYFLSDAIQLELIWSRQRTDLEPVEVTLSGETPVVAGAQQLLFPIGIDYLHGAFVYGGGPEVFRPYVLLGAGLARLSPDVASVSAVNKFSFSVVTGFKSYFTARFGVRLDARAFGTRAGEEPEDIACAVIGCVSFESSATFWQGQIVGGFIIAF